MEYTDSTIRQIPVPIPASGNGVDATAKCPLLAKAAHSPRSIIMPSTAEQDIGQSIVEHMPHLRRYARSLTHSADQADDLVQDCVTRALTKVDLYQPHTNLRAWLFTILRHTAFSHGRRAKLGYAHSARILSIAPMATQPTQLDHVALKETLELVKALPATERQAVVLLSLFDLSYREAAQQAGTKQGTMKSRFSRGRAHMRQLADYQPDHSAH
jgi:RNA polymerase sigma-70 factor (ECF subfamily)